MTDQEHDTQRNLVALSLLRCPPDSRHRGKGHESTDRNDRDGHH
ncbi:MAG TPA: hypothetical protein VFN44_22135 [Solirubrobacteraceae bacterium]|nr:hypothetical protein [Solirubrobacteraceae bacterium]